MGLGQLFNRNIKYQATNTVTNDVTEFTVITDSGGLAPTWASAGYRGAMAVPGAWRASNLLADLLGGLPWDLYEKQPDGTSVQVPSDLLEQPCPPDVRATSFSSLVLDYLFHGNAVAVYTAFDEESGFPTAMVPVPAERVGVRRARESDQGVPRGEAIYEIGSERFAPWQLLHVKGPCEPSALRGMGVLEAHLESLELSKELAKQAKAGSGAGIPTGVLKVSNPDATTTSMQKAKTGWMKAQAERTVAVLNATTDFKPLAWNPTEAQLIEARQFSLHETALIFNIDPSWLGVSTKSKTYMNLETIGLDLSKFSLNGMLTRFEQNLSLATPMNQYVKANLDALLRPDTLTRYQAHAAGINAGWLLPSEVREIEKRKPHEGIDERPRVAVAPQQEGRGDE